MNQNVVKIGLVMIAVIAAVGVVVAASSTIRKTGGLFSKAGPNLENYKPKNLSTKVAGDTATISFTTGENTLVFVEYGNDQIVKGIQKPEEQFTKPDKNHTVILKGLADNTKYFFTVRTLANDQVYNDESGNPFTFTTPLIKKIQYPPCEVEKFKTLYGAQTTDSRYDKQYDLYPVGNPDGLINSNDFFQCIKANPPQ